MAQFIRMIDMLLVASLISKANRNYYMESRSIKNNERNMLFLCVSETTLLRLNTGF